MRRFLARFVFGGAALAALPVASQSQDLVSSSAPKAPRSRPMVHEEDPILITKGGISLRRSEINAALRTLPPRFRKMKLDDIFPLLINQLLYNRDGPLDALRD